MNPKLVQLAHLAHHTREAFELDEVVIRKYDCVVRAHVLEGEARIEITRENSAANALYDGPAAALDQEAEGWPG